MAIGRFHGRRSRLLSMNGNAISKPIRMPGMTRIPTISSEPREVLQFLEHRAVEPLRTRQILRMRGISSRTQFVRSEQRHQPQHRHDKEDKSQIHSKLPGVEHSEGKRG